MKKLLTILAVAAIMTAGMTGCSGSGSQSASKTSGTAPASGFGADKLEKIKSSGTLTVGCDPTIQNICYLDSATGSQTGFIPDIVNGFAKQLGVKVKWETLEWSAMISALNSGKVDMVAANMNMTTERESQILLTDPWLLDHAKACVSNSSKFKTFADISQPGVKFGVTQGSSYEDTIRTKFPKAKIVTLSAGTWQDSLKSGVIDVAYDDGVVFAGPSSKDKSLKVLSENGDAYMDGFAFAAGNYVSRDTFNLYLSKLKVSGDYAAMYQKWMGYKWAPVSDGTSY